MNLETRVETLEHEFKILKNEIEETLLEIQNQVLIHYYPALRAEDLTPPQEIPTTPPTQKLPKETLAGGENAVTEWTTPMETAGIPRQDTVLGNIPHTDQNGREDSSTPQSESNPTAIPMNPVAMNPVALTQLANWVGDSIARVGKAETAEIVTTYADAHHCTEAVKVMLLQFIALQTETAVPEEIETTTLMEVLINFTTVLHQVTALEQALPA